MRTLTYYECGKRFPQAAQLYKLAKALGVSTEYLKNDEIEDPSYGMDRMDYVEEMRQKGGRRESLDLEEMLRENQALFRRRDHQRGGKGRLLPGSDEGIPRM